MKLPNLFGNTSYVNEGPDPRLRGPLGAILAKLQRMSLKYSQTPPVKVVDQSGAWGQFSIYDPFFFALFLKRNDDLYWSARFGWRYDQNIGDGNNPKEPVHTPPGGYFLDVIIKPKIDKIVGN